MTSHTAGQLPRIPGLQYADHVAFTVPDLDEAVRFFVEALGAEELYRSTRGPDPEFMSENFDVPQDAALTLAMLRMPPTSTWSCSSGAAPTAAPSTRGTATQVGTTCASWSTTWTWHCASLPPCPVCACSATARKWAATARASRAIDGAISSRRGDC